MSDDPVSVDVVDGVATLTLNQPGVRNALTEPLSNGLVEAVGDLETESVRVLVLEGAGDAFCAGGDVDAMVERMSGEMSLADAVQHVRQVTGRAVERVARFPAPTVAKIDGVAYGAGGALAIATDVQLASDDAAISFGFRNVGLAVDSGTSYLLPRVVGENTAKELVFTGERVGADRAERLGLFNRVYPASEFEERADEFVDRIASGPTVALRESKGLLDQGLDSSLSQAIHNEASAQAAVFETRDHREGATAFMENRDAEFEGR